MNPVIPEEDCRRISYSGATESQTKNVCRKSVHGIFHYALRNIFCIKYFTGAFVFRAHICLLDRLSPSPLPTLTYLLLFNIHGANLGFLLQLSWAELSYSLWSAIWTTPFSSNPRSQWLLTFGQFRFPNSSIDLNSLTSLWSTGGFQTLSKRAER